MAEGDILAAGTPDELRARVRSDRMPDPTMEDAFIHLIEEHEAGRRPDAVPEKS
jgi:ABC-2 type transport system ATP-binding protein